MAATQLFVLPAYPATIVKDPTGAGDSFAGGFMGYLAGQNKTDFATLKKAVAYGTVVASFTISDFSLKGLTKTTRRNIDSRLNELRKLVKVLATEIFSHREHRGHRDFRH